MPPTKPSSQPADKERAAKLDKLPVRRTRELYGEDESVIVMDAKSTGNIGRWMNVSFIGESLEINLLIHLSYNLENSIAANPTFSSRMSLWTLTIFDFLGWLSLRRRTFGPEQN